MLKPFVAMQPPIIIAFEHPHEVGSVCCPPCQQCGEFEGYLGHMMGDDGSAVPIPAMKIVRQADYHEWLECAKRNNAKHLHNYLTYFYEVQMD